jgi:hypothetical protein
MNWMTPNTMDSLDPKSQEALEHEATHRAGRSDPNNLRDQVSVREGMRNWPTATASDAHTDNLASTQQTPGSMHSVTLPQAVTRDWLTPRANAPENDSGFVERNGDRGAHCFGTLNDQVKAYAGQPRTDSGQPAPDSGSTGGNLQGSLDTTAQKSWPTPNRLDHVNGETPEQFEKRREKWAAQGINLQMPLKTAINQSWATPEVSNGTGPWEGRQGGPNLQTQAAGKLNPSWVETLMAFPIGWSQLPTKFVKPRKETP